MTMLSPRLQGPTQRGLRLARRVLTLLLLAVALVACDRTDPLADDAATRADRTLDRDAVKLSIAARLDRARALSTLATAVEQAGLTTALDREGPFTLFAPANRAFGPLDVPALLADKRRLADVLAYHVVPGRLTAAELRGTRRTVATLAGATLRLGVVEGPRGEDILTVNGQRVVQADIGAANGVIHVLDGVLLETLTVAERAQVTRRLGTLAGAVEQAGLTATLDAADAELTVFAPTDAAFDALLSSRGGPLSPSQLARVLRYHVVPGVRPAATLDAPTAAIGATFDPVATLATALDGADVRVRREGDTLVLNGGQARVQVEDVRAANGLIHVLDGVLTPPGFER